MQLAGVEEAQIRLVDESRRVQHGVASTIAQSRSRQPPQLLVSACEELVPRGGAPVRNTLDENGEGFHETAGRFCEKGRSS
ncbi:MAG TPA: hypothetical protein VFP68_18445 [Burkholderiaceae bacterium]|nr:hypothetical protein [Burkholderiaceae bacterium]